MGQIGARRNTPDLEVGTRLRPGHHRDSDRASGPTGFVPLARAVVLDPVVTLLQRGGAPIARLLASAGLTEWMLRDPESLIPLAGLARFMAVAARSQGIESLGLLAGQALLMDGPGVFGRLLCDQPTFRDALETAIAHAPTFGSGGRLWLAPHGPDLQLCHTLIDEIDDGREQLDHYVLMGMLAIIRLAGGPTWHPTDVQVQTDESAVLRTAEALSGASITFSQPATAIVFPRALLDRPLQNPGNGAEGPAPDVGSWKASSPAGDFVGSVAQLIDLLSWDGYPSIQTTADAAGMSVRSLQRHLTAAGVTHDLLVARTRQAGATQLLEQTDAKVIDIALDLGYSDHAHFTRAFRRWTGQSPREFRRASRQDRTVSGPSPA